MNSHLLITVERIFIKHSSIHAVMSKNENRSSILMFNKTSEKSTNDIQMTMFRQQFIIRPSTRMFIGRTTASIYYIIIRQARVRIAPSKILPWVVSSSHL